MAPFAIWLIAALLLIAAIFLWTIAEELQEISDTVHMEALWEPDEDEE